MAIISPRQFAPSSKAHTMKHWHWPPVRPRTKAISTGKTRSRRSGWRVVRDRAIFTLGWSGAMRRSEIVALDVDDLQFVPQGVEVRLRRSPDRCLTRQADQQ